MALIPQLLKPNQPIHFPTSTSNSHLKPSFFQHRQTTQMAFQSNINRRRSGVSIVVATASILLGREGIGIGIALDFGITVPDQTVEEAENGIKRHAESLLQVKELLEAELWKEAQKALRKSSSFLKQDIYTIIQAKAGIERPQLRKLYSILFNSVTRLDYAARDKDSTRVRECYDNIVVVLNDIFSRI